MTRGSGIATVWIQSWGGDKTQCRGQQRRRALHHFGDGILAGSSTLKSIRFRHSAVTENSSSLERAVTGSHGQSRGQSLDSAKMGSPMNRLLRQGIKREFLAQRVSRYLVGHVHSHVHRYMRYPRPWTVNGEMVGSGVRPQYGHSTAQRALFCRLLFKQNAMQACSCLAVGSAFLPSKTQMMQLRSTSTRLGIASSLRAEDRVVLSCPAVPWTEIS